MPKLYTKTGDNGHTSLYDGNRISKTEIFFDVVGDLDELSSNIGMLCFLANENGFLRIIQAKLLNIGSNIAVVDEKKKNRVKQLTNVDVKSLEEYIDLYESKNPKLTEFILPGTNTADSQAHICRSITRRLERQMWKLNKSDYIVEGKTKIDMKNVKVDIVILKFINRLSDFFFSYARYLSYGEIKLSEIKF